AKVHRPANRATTSSTTALSARGTTAASGGEVLLALGPPSAPPGGPAPAGSPVQVMERAATATTIQGKPVVRTIPRVTPSARKPRALAHARAGRRRFWLDICSAFLRRRRL